MMKFTTQVPGICRILLFHHPLLREPQPAMVVGGPFSEPATPEGGEPVFGPHVNVNVFVDGANYPAFLKELRGRESGNTFTSVPVFAPISPEDRDELKTVQSTVGVWCEWPPRV